jgi:hypothetical protein
MAGPAAQSPPRNGNGSRVTWNAKRSRNCFVCGEPGHFARDHTSVDGPKSVATDGPTGQARGITALESPADVYLKVKLNGRMTFALMDTGCEKIIFVVAG